MDVDFKKILKENKDPEYIVSCLSLLTSVEKSIILILHSKRIASNTKQIQDEFILNVVYFLQTWFQEGSELGDEIERKFKNKVKLLPYYDFSPDDLNTLHNEIFSIDDEMKGKKPMKLDTSQASINYYKKKFTKCEVNYPSFEKIDSDLETLKKMNLVLKRKTSDKKSKGLWAINPMIDYYLKKTKINLYKD